MSDPLVFDRHVKLPPAGPERLCRFCRKPITDARRSAWCSKECSTEGAIRMDGGYARWKVEERDHGVCAACGMDTEYVKRTLDPLLREAANRWQETALAQDLRMAVALALEDLGFSRRVAFGSAGHRWVGSLSTHLWEANHIVPVVNGGGGCGMENLETLCRPCHARATAKLSGERAKTKRLASKERRHRERLRLKQRRLL